MASYLLWVEIDGFFADHHRECAKPLLVTRDKRVLDANPLARHRGARIGVPTRQAKAVIADCEVKEWKEEEYMLRRHQWLDLCTDFTGIIEPLDQNIAALDLSGHPNPVDVTERLIRDLVNQTQLPIRYGAAPSVWIAQLAAKYQDLGRAAENPTRFLASLSVKDLLPVQESVRERLHFLGHRTIGEVAKLPLATVQAQFGEEAITILASAQGRLSQPVRPLYPLDSLQECLLFDGSVQDWEIFNRALQELAERIGKRLTEKSMQSSKVAIRLETEERVLKMERRFTKPINSILSALIALRLMIPNEIVDPIVGLQITLTDLETVRSRQKELEGFNLRNKRTDATAAISYVRTVFGDESVKLGNQIEIPRRLRVLKEWQNATGWR